MKYWEIIADKLSAAGWSWSCVSAVDSRGQNDAEKYNSDAGAYVGLTSYGHDLGHYPTS